MTMRLRALWEALKMENIVLVHDFDGFPMGKGFINMNSKNPHPDDDKKNRCGGLTESF